jgi:hypothetical protein
MGKTIAEDLIEKGHKKGLQEGVRTQRRMLVKGLKHKFGKIPLGTLKRIEATEQIDLLDEWYSPLLRQHGSIRNRMTPNHGMKKEAGFT